MQLRDIGPRLKWVRSVAGRSLEDVAAASGTTSARLHDIEEGHASVEPAELLSLIKALNRPLAFFMAPDIDAVVSRRQNPGETHTASRLLELELQHFAADVVAMDEVGVDIPVAARENPHTPGTVKEAEAAAGKFRKQIGSDPLAPVDDLVAASEQLGLLVLITGLGAEGADGGCVEVGITDGPVGVAVVNADSDSGRKRMTIAHELGHWLFGDAYDTGARLDAEKMINAFAIHFLAPRQGIVKAWNEMSHVSTRDRATILAAEYRLSWSASLGHLCNLKLLENSTRDLLIEEPPKGPDFERLGVTMPEDQKRTILPPAFTDACLRAYASAQVTGDRILQVLRGTVQEADLPDLVEDHSERIRRAFQWHRRA